MTKRLAALFIMGLSIAAVAGCGRKGPLELPPGRAPMAVERLSAALEGGAVRLTWTNPVKTVAGNALGPLAVVEVWIFDKDLPAAGSVPTPEAVEKSARLLLKVFAAGRGETMSRTLSLPGGAKSPAFTVRVVDRKGRASEFSPVAVADVPRAPAGAVLPEREGP